MLEFILGFLLGAIAAITIALFGIRASIKKIKKAQDKHVIGKCTIYETYAD